MSGSTPEAADVRQRLLDAAVQYVTDHGVAGVSLRQLAAALGTSHRMLIYHFGSKEALLVAIIQTVERRQREVLASLAEAVAAADDDALVDVARRFWRHLSDPSMWPHERLFFEMYGQALQGRPGTTTLLNDVVESWLEPLATIAQRHGVPPERAHAQARLGVAAVRGLLLDLLATGDRAGVDAAAEEFITSWAKSLPGRQSAS